MNRENQIFFSVLGSIVLHLLLFLFAVMMLGFSGLMPPEAAEASIPNEVVIYLPEVIAEVEREEKAKEQPFMRTSEKNRTAEAPKDAAFESDKNTIAASEGAAGGEGPLPTQEGVEKLPFLELEDRDYVDGKEASEDASVPAAPAVVAMAAPATAAAAVMPVPEERVADPVKEGEVGSSVLATEIEERSFSDRLDPIEVMPRERDVKEVEGEEEVNEKLRERMAEPRPKLEENPVVEPAEPTAEREPAPDNAAYRPHTRASSMRGTISNRGPSSVSAAETPLGRYKAVVGQAIEKLWHRYREENADFLVYGSIKLEFKVDREGNPRNVKVLKNDANAIMVDFTLSAILKADIPPMPEEIVDILEDEALNVTYDVIIY